MKIFVQDSGTHPKKIHPKKTLILCRLVLVLLESTQKNLDASFSFFLTKPKKKPRHLVRFLPPPKSPPHSYSCSPQINADEITPISTLICQIDADKATQLTLPIPPISCLMMPSLLSPSLLLNDAVTTVDASIAATTLLITRSDFLKKSEFFIFFIFYFSILYESPYTKTLTLIKLHFAKYPKP